MASINSLTKLRLTGLSSGLDTDTIIKDLMRIQQFKIDRELRARTQLLWKQESLTGIKDELTSFRQNFLSVLGTNSMVKDATYNTYSVNVTGKSADAVSVKGTIDSKVGAVTINQVKQLAQGAKAESTWSSKPRISKDNMSLDVTDRLDELNLKTPIQFNASGQASFSINGVKIYANESDTLSDLMNRVNSSGAGVTMKYTDTNESERISITSNTSSGRITIENHEGNIFGGALGGGAFDLASGTYLNGSTERTGISTGGGLADNNNVALRNLKFATPLQFENGEISFAINGKQFTFKDTDTLNHMMSTINGSGIGVTMNYSRVSDKITFETIETGENQRLVIENIKGNAFAGALSGGGAFGISPGAYGGCDAVVTINGYDVWRSSNHFTVDGLEYTLNRVTNADDEPITATVSRDISGAVEKIKTFVDDYNKLIGKLESLLVEKKTKDEQSYTPLTDEEKAEMTEKQIEQWEDIAKKGLLRNDSGIQNLVTALRGALYESVTAAGLSPSQIGLGTASYFDKELSKGQIALDEDKLRAALERDPQQVMSVFANISESADASTSYKENGLMFRIDNIMRQYINGSQSNSLDSLERSLSDAAKKISTLQQKMEDEIERYYQKFAAMETALANIQSQSDWLSSQLAGLNG